MALLASLKKILRLPSASRKHSGRSRDRRLRTRLGIEPLEDRTLPSGIALAGSTFFGGAGDQRGSALAIANGSIYLTGNLQPEQQQPGDTGLLLNYSVAPGSTPVWSRTFPFGTDLRGIAATNEGVYAGGWNYSLTSDPVGGKEVKTLVGKFAPDGSDGPGPGGAAWVAGSGGTASLASFFVYSGVEMFNAFTTAVEGGSQVLYAAGGGQPGSYFAYLVAKYDSAGHRLAAATDSTVGIDFNTNFGSYDTSSGSQAVTVLNGNVYVAGDAHPGTTNGNDRPTIWKHDPNLNLIWRQRDPNVLGRLEGITGFDAAVYGVGWTYADTNSSEDYLIEKYDEAGNRLWTSVFGGAGRDVLMGVVGIEGRLFAVGSTDSEGAGGADGVIFEFDTTTGDVLSKTLFGGPQVDKFNGVATDGTDLYVVGESRSFASGAGNAVGQNDVVLLRYAVDAPAVGNGLIAFQSNRDGDFEIFTMNADGSNQTQLTNNIAHDFGPDWSPDGSKIAFTSERNANNVDRGQYEIYVMNADGTDQTRLTNNLADNQQPVWSPDGTKIAFHSNPDGIGNIYVMNADGTNQTRLTSQHGTGPDWSPDGSKIAFYSQRDGIGHFQIYVMNADGSNQTRLTNFSGNDSNPAWSPEGAKIAFQREGYANDPNVEIYVMNADGSGQTNLTNHPANDAQPVWSPDGAKIAFRSLRDGNEEIYVMNADGSGQTRLTNNAATDGEPAWQRVQANPFAGAYTGSFSGTVEYQGDTQAVSGLVAFTVDGSGNITVTSPGEAHGTVTPTGDASGNGTVPIPEEFGISGTVSYAFTGKFTASSGAASANGNWTVTFSMGSGSGTWNAVSSARVSPTVTVSAADGAYNGEPFPASATATGVDGAVVSGSFTFTYTDSQGIFSSTAPTDAGAYTVVASFTSTDVNYTDAQSDPLAFSIAPATPTLTVSAAGGAFNGQPYPASATATGVDGAAVSGDFDFTYTDSQGIFSSTAPTDAGAYTVVASFTSTDVNYTDAQSDPLAFSISPAEPTVTVPATADFTGKPVLPAATATGVAGETVSGNFTYRYADSAGRVLPTAPTNVGTYRVTTFFASRNPNYRSVRISRVVFTIAKARTSTSLTSSANPSRSGKPVTFTVTVSPAAGSKLVIPAGTIDLFVDNRLTPIQMVNGKAKLTLANLAPGRHTVKAVYRGATNIRGSNATLTQFVQDPLKPPQPLAPKGTILTTTPIFTWNAVKNAEFYDLQLTDATTGAQVFQKLGVVGTSLPTPQALTPGHKYQWIIRAGNNQANRSPWSQATAFAIPTLLPTPKQLTFKGGFAGSAVGTIILPLVTPPNPSGPFINITTYDNHLSGTLTFVITGDGSLSSPYQGAMSGQCQNNAILLSQTVVGAPGTFSSSMNFGTVSISSNLHQITAQGAGNLSLPLGQSAGFQFSFNGFVSVTEGNITGTLTVTFLASTGFGFNGNLTMKMGVVAQRQ